MLLQNMVYDCLMTRKVPGVEKVVIKEEEEGDD